MSEDIVTPEKTGISVFPDISLEILLPHFNWTFFFHEWRLNGRHPGIFNDLVKGDEAKRLYADAIQVLDQITSKKLLKANGVAGIFPAASRGDDVILFSDDTHMNEIAFFPFLRNQQQNGNEPNHCLADFIASSISGKKDHIGLFAVTAGIGADDIAEQYRKEGDDYNSMMVKILADRLAEAFAEYLHQKVAKEIWGYAKNENIGIRPAPGYPACPDHHTKFEIFKLLDAETTTDISLTETAMMIPAASVCGFYFANPKAKYFSVGKIDREQLLDYAKRKNWDVITAEKWLGQQLV